MTVKSHQHTLNILLADDGSQHSQAAIQLLCDLPLRHDTRITAISVFSPRLSSDHEWLRQSLANTKTCLLDSGLHVQSELILGYPAERLIEFAETLDPDLIVLGAKGLRATLGILLGGVAQQVVEYANWPVLVVRAPYKTPQRLLVAIDGSEYSQSAMEYLSGFPLLDSSEIHIIHVMPPAPDLSFTLQSWPPAPEIIQPPMQIDPDEIKQMLVEQEQLGKQLLSRAEALLSDCGNALITSLRRGDAATEIIDYIKTNDIGLVVLGSRGLSPVRSWLLGSVSRKIIHYSDCSVLVVK